MITTEREFLKYLDINHFTYQRVEHPAVFTCAEAELHRPDTPAVSTKNLFICDKKGRKFFLVVTACEKTVQLDNLSLHLGVSHLRFVSEENLLRMLGVTRGAVTMMGLANDSDHKIELWIDADIWESENFLCHPLVNTATLILTRTELERFFTLTGHKLHFFSKKQGGHG